MMVENNISCFGDIIGKTDLCNEMSFSKVGILAIFRFAGIPEQICECLITKPSKFAVPNSRNPKMYGRIKREKKYIQLNLVSHERVPRKRIFAQASLAKLYQPFLTH